MQIAGINYINTLNKNYFKGYNKSQTSPFSQKTENKNFADVNTANNVSFYGWFDKKPEKTDNATNIPNLSGISISKDSQVNYDLSNKIESAMYHLQDNRGIIFVGKTLENTLWTMQNFNRKVNTLLDNIYFINNDSECEYAIYKDNGKYSILKTDIGGSIMLKDTLGRENNFVSLWEPKEIKDDINIETEDYKTNKKEIIKLSIHPQQKDDMFEKYVKKYSYLDNVDINSFNNSRINSIKNPQKNTKKHVNNTIKFSDVGGQDENIKKLEEEVIFPLKYPQFYEGVKQNKGILLYGPPRCGKTLMALALANEAGVNFIKLGPSDLTQSYVGETEKNWRDVFEEAKEKQPSIIFIDEFENVAVKRKGEGENSIVKDDVVSQLLVLMSDLEKSNDRVYVIAATNRKDLIDPAMLNSGRFGLALEVKEPDLKGTKQIFDINRKNIKFIDENIDADDICNLMYENKFNGANIVEVFGMAHKQALKRNGLIEKMRNETITQEDNNNFKIEQTDFIAAVYSIAEMKKN